LLAPNQPVARPSPAISRRPAPAVRLRRSHRRTLLRSLSGGDRRLPGAGRRNPEETMPMAYEPTRDWNAFVIVAMVIYKYLLLVVGVLVVFVVCTARRIDITPFDADKIVPVLGHVWFSLPAQYQAIKLVNGEVSANNYAFFNLILLSMYPLLLLYTAYYYNKVRKKCEFPKLGDWRDLTICAVVLVIGVFFVLLDYPSDRPGVSSFRADTHGWYFFHQAFFTTAVIMGPMMLVVFLMKRVVGRQR
jgi:hypothetical protein